MNNISICIVLFIMEASSNTKIIYNKNTCTLSHHMIIVISRHTCSLVRGTDTADVTYSMYKYGLVGIRIIRNAHSKDIGL